MKRLLLVLFSISFLAAMSSAQFAGNLVINEFVASNDSVGGYQEPDGGFGDWVELYNNGSSTLNLEGINFSDDLAELDKWSFPAGTTIAAGGYLIVWADDDLDQTGIHASFRLSRAGEDVVLSQNGTIIDQHTYGEQETNISEARIPNGTGNFVSRTPTPNGNNETSSTREPATLRLKAFPNPTANLLYVKFGAERFDSYEVINITGAIVRRGELGRGADELLLDVTELAAGQYQMVLGGGKATAGFTRL